MLSDSDSGFGDLHTLSINEHYAKAFPYRKEREEFATYACIAWSRSWSTHAWSNSVEEKYLDGSDASDDEKLEDSKDTSEDSDGAELTPAVDAAILRTLPRIRKKDPGIYDGDKQVFEVRFCHSP